MTVFYVPLDNSGMLTEVHPSQMCVTVLGLLAAPHHRGARGMRERVDGPASGGKGSKGRN